MKNKFLLLGATALLSTVLAINVKADTITQTFKVSVGLVKNIYELVKIDDLSFGKIIAQSSSSDGGKSTVVATDGSVNGSATYLGYAKPARLRTNGLHASSSAVPMKHDIELTMNTENGALYTSGETPELCGYVTAWQHTNDKTIQLESGDWDQLFEIGATFTLPAADWNVPFGENISCSGTATATLIMKAD